MLNEIILVLGKIKKNPDMKFKCIAKLSFYKVQKTNKLINCAKIKIESYLASRYQSVLQKKKLMNASNHCGCEYFYKTTNHKVQFRCSRTFNFNLISDHHYSEFYLIFYSDKTRTQSLLIILFFKSIYKSVSYCNGKTNLQNFKILNFDFLSSYEIMYSF
jgi:hypothetical protein